MHINDSMWIPNFFDHFPPPLVLKMTYKKPFTLFEKSIFFVQKFNFDKPPTFSRVFHPIFFDNFSREIKVVNS